MIVPPLLLIRLAGARTTPTRLPPLLEMTVLPLFEISPPPAPRPKKASGTGLGALPTVAFAPPPRKVPSAPTAVGLSAPAGGRSVQPSAATQAAMSNQERVWKAGMLVIYPLTGEGGRVAAPTTMTIRDIPGRPAARGARTRLWAY
ncbi:hypothetical protein D3C72_1044010 [compost metagenome]